MLKQFKMIILAPKCFGSCRNHHQGAILCLAKTKNALSVLVSIDVVNVMAAYQPVVQVCGSQWRQEHEKKMVDTFPRWVKLLNSDEHS